MYCFHLQHTHPAHAAMIPAVLRALCSPIAQVPANQYCDLCALRHACVLATQLPSSKPYIPPKRGHKALNGGTSEAAGCLPLYQAIERPKPRWPPSGPSETSWAAASDLNLTWRSGILDPEGPSTQYLRLLIPKLMSTCKTYVYALCICVGIWVLFWETLVFLSCTLHVPHSLPPMPRQHPDRPYLSIIWAFFWDGCGIEG